METASLAEAPANDLAAFFLVFFRSFGLSLSGFGDVVIPALRAPKKRRRPLLRYIHRFVAA